MKKTQKNRINYLIKGKFLVEFFLIKYMKYMSYVIKTIFSLKKGDIFFY